MVAPATNQIVSEFGIYNSALVAFTTTIFVLGYGDSSFAYRIAFVSHSDLVAIGPLFIGPLSEIYGRSRVLQLANLWFFGTI